MRCSHHRGRNEIRSRLRYTFHPRNGAITESLNVCFHTTLVSVRGVHRGEPVTHFCGPVATVATLWFVFRLPPTVHSPARIRTGVAGSKDPHYWPLNHGTAWILCRPDYCRVWFRGGNHSSRESNPARICSGWDLNPRQLLERQP